MTPDLRRAGELPAGVAFDTSFTQQQLNATLAEARPFIPLQPSSPQRLQEASQHLVSERLRESVSVKVPTPRAVAEILVQVIRCFCDARCLRWAPTDPSPCLPLAPERPGSSPCRSCTG
jgi:hypothetical protein